LEEDPVTQSTFPPAGVQQPYGQPYGQPVGGPGAPFGQPAPPFGYQQPPKKKTGLIVGSIVGAVVLIGGLVVGAIFLFGSKTLDQGDAEQQVSAASEQLTGTAVADVSCPADVEVEQGGTFTCTATLEGQDISFTVTQKDDEGNVEITADNTFVPVSAVADEVNSQVEAEAGVELTTACDGGERTVLVDPAGERIPCTVTNAEDSSLSIDVTAIVEADGTVTVEYEDA
jgi:cytoskeletal protein RodZ